MRRGIAGYALAAALAVVIFSPGWWKVGALLPLFGGLAAFMIMSPAPDPALPARGALRPSGAARTSPRAAPAVGSMDLAAELRCQDRWDTYGVVRPLEGTLDVEIAHEPPPAWREQTMAELAPAALDLAEGPPSGGSGAGGLTFALYLPFIIDPPPEAPDPPLAAEARRALDARRDQAEADARREALGRMADAMERQLILAPVRAEHRAELEQQDQDAADYLAALRADLASVAAGGGLE
jgi:hypothetical protein